MVSPSLSTNLPSHLSLKLLKEALDVRNFKRARQLFDNIPQPDPTTSSTLISALTTHGLLNEAINICTSLRERGIKLDIPVFMAVAKACAASRDALNVKELHNDATRCGAMFNVFVGNALIHAYGKCKCVEGERRVFDDMVVRDVGLNVFHEMGWNGVKLDPVTVSSILPACADLKDLKSGKAIHGFAVRNGMVENVFVCNALVNLYAKCLCVREAHAIFDLMPHRDVVSWSGVLTYFTNKEYEKGLSLFSQMCRDGVETNEVTWSIVIGGCMENR
ncbi:putative pentatricopeptide [Medicago truncatula]|uniref:Putative pentatricopeptide n=1 Tax=Medicago truncatula TaxID=3880 RepID=A0A396JG33_MEDTR|nr:putative pentatricopeptide [Medicago truncatula]